ncbi:MAG: PIN domain-containing protein [Deltaproteobacteria bacterium]|nr:PIN domain-containing protein [Deltaproteobacteria bacterium]
MIYLDTSAALAHIFDEPTKPPAGLWHESLVSSQLLEYELWVRLHSRRLGESHGDAARALLSQIAFLDLSHHILARAQERSAGSPCVSLRTMNACSRLPRSWVSAPISDWLVVRSRRLAGSV